MTIANHEQLRERIRAVGLSEHEAAIVELARPCIRLRRKPVEQSVLSPLDSRLGGNPHLPIGFEWPTWRRRPLGHIATIRLSEASALDATGLLPKQGLLYFWYDLHEQPWGFDPKDAGFSRVDFVPDENMPLELRSPPEREPTSDQAPEPLLLGPTRPCLVTFLPALTLPNSEWLDEYSSHHEQLGDLCAYSNLCYNCIHSPKNQLLGYPCPQQGPMELECQLVTHGLGTGYSSVYQDPRAEKLKDGAKDWRLLLQIDTDEDGPGWMWGDVGMIYYWIPEPALRARDFSKSWMILQCG